MNYALILSKNENENEIGDDYVMAMVNECANEILTLFLNAIDASICLCYCEPDFLLNSSEFYN